MTRTRAWITAAIVTISFVGLAVLIGASTGTLGFRQNFANAGLVATADNTPRDTQSNSVTVSFSESEGDDDDAREDDDDDDGESHREREDDDEHEDGEDD